MPNGPIHPLAEVYREGDTRHTYTEVVKSAAQEVRVMWKGLSAPYCFSTRAMRRSSRNGRGVRYTAPGT